MGEVTTESVMLLIYCRNKDEHSNKEEAVKAEDSED